MKNKDWQKQVNHILVGLCAAVTELKDKVDTLEAYNEMLEARNIAIMKRLDKVRKTARKVRK